MTSLTRSLLPAALLACGLITFTGCGEVLNSPDAGTNATDGNSVDALVNLPDATPPDPCAGDIAAEDLATCFLETVCATMNRCYGMFPSVEACVDAGGPFNRGGNRGAGATARGVSARGGHTFLVGLQRLVDAIGGGTVTYNPTRAGTCIADVAGISCPDLYFTGDPSRSPACQGTFTGTVAGGGTCYEEEECMGADSDCQPPETLCELQCCAGSCKPAHAMGEDCTDTFNCLPGLHCVSGATGGAACESGDANAPCWGYGDCDEGLWCEVPIGGGRGLCKADFPADASCTLDEQCPRPQRCVGNNLAGSTIGTCAPVHTEGAACDGNCDGPFYCDWPDTSVTGTCKPYPDLNEDCSTTYTCRGQLWCDPTDERCKAPKTSGVTCTGTYQCGSPLFCTTDIGINPGSCRAPQNNNTLCNDGYQCNTGVCAGSTATPGTFQCSDYGSCW